MNPLLRSSVKIDRQMAKSIIIFVAGTIGIAVGAEPFIHSLEGFSADVGMSAVVLVCNYKSDSRRDA